MRKLYWYCSLLVDGIFFNIEKNAICWLAVHQRPMMTMMRGHLAWLMLALLSLLANHKLFSCVSTLVLHCQAAFSTKKTFFPFLTSLPSISSISTLCQFSEVEKGEQAEKKWRHLLCTFQQTAKDLISWSRQLSSKLCGNGLLRLYVLSNDFGGFFLTANKESNLYMNDVFFVRLT